MNEPKSSQRHKARKVQLIFPFQRVLRIIRTSRLKKIWARYTAAYQTIDDWLEEHFPAWQKGAIFFIILATIGMLINFSLTLGAIMTHKRDSTGLGTLYLGDCNKAAWLDSLTHAFINVLSTVSEDTK